MAVFDNAAVAYAGQVTFYSVPRPLKTGNTVDGLCDLIIRSLRNYIGLSITKYCLYFTPFVQKRL